MAKIRFSKPEIVSWQKTEGYGSRQQTYDIFAIRRIKSIGWFKKKHTVQFLDLRNMDTPKWDDAPSFIPSSMDNSFYYSYTVKGHDKILEKWNYKPKSEEQKFREKYGTPVDLKDLENWEEVQENENRLNRLGVDNG